MMTRIPLRSHWQDWASLLLGIWLFASPWMFQYTDATLATQNAWVVGILLFCVAVLSRFAFHLAEEYVDFLLGIWLLISPWALSYHETMTALINALCVGALVAILAIWEIGELQPGEHRPA